MLVTRPSQASHAESELAGCGDEILVRIMLSYLFSRAHKDMDKKQHPLCPFYVTEFHIIPGKHQSFCFGQLAYPATSAGQSLQSFRTVFNIISYQNHQISTNKNFLSYICSYLGLYQNQNYHGHHSPS